jgi:hypothetical protein
MCFARTVLAFVAVSSLSGCAGTEATAGWGNRYGPNPALPAEAITKSSDNQVRIMSALFEVAHDSNHHTTPYLVTLAGFNFVDEQCDAYLHELFAIEHEHEVTKKGIDQVGLLSNAVLGAVPASKTTMAIVAQAFGLASQYTDTIANSYLLGAHTSTILGIVSKLQLAYRDQAALDKAKINSEPEAYFRIRGYLQLCMPPTIESKINETLTSATAAAGEQATGKSVGPGTALATKLIPQ